MAEHRCEYQTNEDYQKNADETMCGDPASRRLTGEKLLEKSWVMEVCEDHRSIAAFVMELRGYNHRKEEALLDTAEGQIANLEDTLLDAVRCAVYNLKPPDGDGTQWLNRLLGSMGGRGDLFCDALPRDISIRGAISQAQVFYEAHDLAAEERA